MSTVKISPKFQVVIPEEIRNRLRLNPGAQFVVIGEGDAIVFKTITPPSKHEFIALLKNARQQARKAGLKKSDIEKAIRRIRSKR